MSEDFPDVTDPNEPDVPAPEGWTVTTYSQDDF